MRFLKKYFWLPMFCSVECYARLYNYQDVPVGERAFGMGFASVAVQADTGNIYYNPASLADSEYGQFSASMSAYARLDTRTGEYVSLFQSAKENISRGGFVAIPSMIGGHVRTMGWVWGGVVLIPESFSISGSLNISSTSLAAYESSFGNVWMGAFVSKRVTGLHSFGLSIFYNSVDSREKFYFFDTSNTPATIRFADQNYNGNGVLAILGGLYDISDELKFGYSLRTPTLLFSGEGTFGDISSEATAASIADRFTLKFIPQPMRLSLGLSWQIDPVSLFAADMHIYSAFNKNLSSGGQEAFLVSSKEVVNFSLGYEYMGWKTWGLRVGIGTNFSSVRKLSQTLSAMNDKVHMLIATGAIVFDGVAGTISLGGYIQAGQGSSVPLTDIGRLVPRSNYFYGLAVGSSYKFK